MAAYKMVIDTEYHHAGRRSRLARQHHQKNSNGAATAVAMAQENQVRSQVV